MEYKGELARRTPGQGLSLLLYSPAHDGKHIKCSPVACGTRDKLNPCPGARWANVVGLITDMILALAYRLLAWHGTMLSDFNL